MRLLAFRPPDFTEERTFIPARLWLLAFRPPDFTEERTLRQ
jgi:hypothetical protein